MRIALGLNIKQIMVVSRVIGRSIWPERFRIASPRVSIDRGAAEVSRNFLGEAILKLKFQIDSLLPDVCLISSGPSLIEG